MPSNVRDSDQHVWSRPAWIKRILVEHGTWLRGDGGKRADLCAAYLQKADLRGALLCDADLHKAILCEADLREADLGGADLYEADLRGVKGYVVGPQRTDGYRFDLRWKDGAWRVVAGCRTEENWTIDDYRIHAAWYGDDAKTAETLTILDYLAARAAQTPTGE